MDECAGLLSRQGVGTIQAERLRVVDEETNDVPADGATMGEIVMRGNNVMKGYFEDEEATAEAFSDGLFHSGGYTPGSCTPTATCRSWTEPRTL